MQGRRRGSDVGRWCYAPRSTTNPAFPRGLDLTATHGRNLTTKAAVPYLAFAPGDTEGRLAFTIGPGQPPRRRSLPARAWAGLRAGSATAEQRFRLPADAPARSCYQAGRAGFWWHRDLSAGGIDNRMADASGVEGNRRPRRATTDRRDAGKLLNRLPRHHGGATKVRGVSRVPGAAAADARPWHRA